MGGTPKVRGSEGLPPELTAGWEDQSQGTHTRKQYCTPGHPFSVYKTPTHITAQARWAGSRPVLQVWKLTGGQALSEWQGWSCSSGVSLASGLHCTEWQRHVTGSEGFVGPKDRGLRKGRAAWGRLHGTAGLLRVDGAQSQVRKLNNQGVRGQG